MSKPVAVLISDIHFTPSTLEVASQALKQAQACAISHDVPLILAGDTLDSKAIIRAECANRIMELIRNSEATHLVLVGNHDLINEKGTEHSLNFLDSYCTAVDAPCHFDAIGATLIPYQSSAEDLRRILEDCRKRGINRVICHQGVQTAYMGHYMQDKSSLPKEEFADFRVISGHYHRRQDIKTGRPRKGAVGLFSYIGNPYTLTFGEASDPQKGFQVLMDDGTLQFVPTHLRRHIVLETSVDNWWEVGAQKPHDLVWLKITGESSELAKVTKADVAKVLGVTNFKLDKLPLEAGELSAPQETKQTESGILDNLIDNLGETEGQKQYLKALYREIMS